MFPLFTTRCLHVRRDVRDPSGGSGNCGRECCPVILSGNFAEMTTSTPFRDLLHAANLRTWDRRLYFPSEGRRAEEFCALKNPTASAGFEPANLGTKFQHATRRPPKVIYIMYIIIKRCPVTGRGGPRGSGYVKVPDFLDVSALQGW